METVQMNIRIPSDVKKQGDAVLGRFGTNPSEMVRSVWAYLAEHQKLPAFAESSADNNAYQKKKELIEQGAGISARFCQATGISEDAFAESCGIAPSDLLYDTQLDEYEALDADAPHRGSKALGADNPLCDSEAPNA